MRPFNSHFFGLPSSRDFIHPTKETPVGTRRRHWVQSYVRVRHRRPASMSAHITAMPCPPVLAGLGLVPLRTLISTSRS